MKKATVKTLAVLIIMVVLMLILFPTFKKIYGVIASDSNDKVCRISVLKHAAFNTMTGELKSTDIQCKRHYVVFGDEKVTKDDKRVKVSERPNLKKSSTYKSLNNHIVNQVVADELYKCWSKMGEGAIDVFEKDFALISNTPCIVCTQISYDVSQDNTFTGLGNYLKTYKIPNGNITYMQFFNKSKMPVYYTLLGQVIPWTQYLTDWESPFIPQIDTMDTNKNYIIYFYGFKPDKLSTMTETLDNSYYLIFSELDDIPKRCEFIYN